MAELKDILYGVNITSSVGNMNVEVKDVCFDSRQVSKGSLFVAVKGTQADGHQFIDRAVQQGAVAVVCEHLPDTVYEKAPASPSKIARERWALLLLTFLALRHKN